MLTKAGRQQASPRYLISRNFIISKNYAINSVSLDQIYCSKQPPFWPLHAQALSKLYRDINYE
jgi:hypothetical protein